MKINTSILHPDGPPRTRGKGRRVPPHGYDSIGFTPEQAARGKKHEGTRAQRVFVGRTLKLKMMGYDNEMLSQALEQMSTEEIGDMDLWSALLGLMRSGMGAEKSYWAHKAGFGFQEIDAVNKLSVDSLKMMVKVNNL